jgi:cytochrome oxidase Cu insertion factor (SCO1/SenC/PrrC family)
VTAAPALAEQLQQPAGQTPTRIQMGKTPEEADAASREFFTNTELVDQDGQVHRFYDDLLRGHLVLINFGFAACTDACQPIAQNLARLQRKLGSRVGDDIRMITLSVDPVNDTPKAWKTFSAKVRAGPGWYFLGGKKAKVEALLKKLGGYTEDRDTHTTMLIIGDPRTGNWLRTLGMEKPDNLYDAIVHLNDPAPPASIAAPPASIAAPPSALSAPAPGGTPRARPPAAPPDAPAPGSTAAAAAR